MNKTEVFVSRLYHIVSLLTACLSIGTILTSTAASTLLLLRNYELPDPTLDVYYFLRTSMDLEFSFTRWSFLTTLLLFLTSICGRILLEFDLLKRRRRLAGLMVVSAMAGTITSFLSYINSILHCWPNLLAMTKHLMYVSIRSSRGNLPFLGIDMLSLHFFLAFDTPACVAKTCHSTPTVANCLCGAFCCCSILLRRLYVARKCSA